MQLIEFDKRAIKEHFEKLKPRYKIQLAKAVSAELGAQNKKHEIKLFKVKKVTIDNAVDAYKEDRDTHKFSMLQLSALLQVLSLDAIHDEDGQIVKKCNFINKKRELLSFMIELERK